MLDLQYALYLLHVLIENKGQSIPIRESFYDHDLTSSSFFHKEGQDILCCTKLIKIKRRTDRKTVEEKMLVFRGC
jgi:hypothetical protein